MTQSRKRGFLVSILALILAGCMTALTGCSEVMPDPQLSSSEEESSLPDESSSEENSSDENDVSEGNLNPMTGLYDLPDEAVGKRPVSIMINNIKIALPQSGISSADIIYEMPVEGGITRMMAVFADYTSIPTTGSIRSSRHNYLELVLPYDSIYVHFGGSTIAYDKIAEYGMKTVDGLKLSSAYYIQDKAVAAAKGKEHSYYIDSEHLQKALADYEIRTDLEGDAVPAFHFDQAYAAPAAATACSELKLPITGYITATFQYDAEKDAYKKLEFGANHIDANTGETVMVHNVFVLYTNIYTIDDKGRQQIDLEGGSGYYITGGKCQEITWSKAGVSEPFVYRDANGGELAVSPGNSWVCIVSDKQKSKAVISE